MEFAVFSASSASSLIAAASPKSSFLLPCIEVRIRAPFLFQILPHSLIFDSTNGPHLHTFRQVPTFPVDHIGLNVGVNLTAFQLRFPSSGIPFNTRGARTLPFLLHSRLIEGLITSAFAPFPNSMDHHLDGVVVCISGDPRFDKDENKHIRNQFTEENVSRWLKYRGGKLVEEVTKTTTHLICSRAAYKEKGNPEGEFSGLLVSRHLCS